MSDDTTTPVGTQTSFGFRTVPEAERQGLVNDVFSTVARRYDLMNDLMSGGLHRLWKNDLVTEVAPPKGHRPFRLLDIAGGTADVALRVLARGGERCEVVLADISEEMLGVGRSKLSQGGYAARSTVVQANAELLPFPDRSFDACTIAFGIRNVTHIDRALSEAYRVLRFGGHFLCLEFSTCQVPFLDSLYDLHSFEVIPRLGRLAAGAAEPYQYLVESIRKFPDQERFATMIRDAGFARVGYRNLSGGIAAIHWGWHV
jgi:demethylmenaquinone methyltransferase/2-methoxy-6-polyprenyl-1,4-benzoquinol methylase